MNKWLVHRYTTANVWLRDRTRPLVERMAARADDRGQNSIEYLGLAVVIAVIIGVLATTDIGTHIKNAINTAIDKVAGGNGK